MKIIDLSQKIYNDMPVHPYDKDVKVIKDKTIKNDKYNNTQVYIGMHAGTHIDAPNHLIENGKTIDAYNLSQFTGKGCVIDVTNQKHIELKEEYKDIILKSEIVLLYTGYGHLFADEKYYLEDAPVLSKEFAEYLAETDIKIVGMDLPSPDRYPFDVHNILLSGDVLIAENLTNLDQLLGIDEFTFCAMPLNINADASIVRAVALVD